MLVLDVVSKSDFDSLKDTMEMYQHNIDSNITWFYSALAIVLAVLIVGLAFIVRNSISIGIEKGLERTGKKIDQLIEDNREFNYASINGPTVIMMNTITISGFNNLRPDNFISLTILNRHGRVLEYHSLAIKSPGNNIGGFEVKLTDYDFNRDGLLTLNVVWRRDIR